MQSSGRQMSGSRQRGMTLVELMVAMVLGLIVVGSAVSLTLANRRSYATNEGLSQVQESARTAFELLARDIRQAGISGCDNTGNIANVLDAAGGNWWQTWFGMRGYDGAQVSTAAAFGAARGDRVAGTDSIQTQGIQGLALSVEDHDPPTASMEIDAAATDIVAGDVMVACDFNTTAIFQVTAYNGASVTLRHNQGGGAPGNCSAGLGFPTDCSSAAGTPHQFRRNALLARLGATEWYIGQSGRATDSGRSLFRQRLGNGGTIVTEEVVADVTDMQVTYRVNDEDQFFRADELAGADWPNVNAIRIELILSSGEAGISVDSGVNAGRLERRYNQVVALRNRIP